jgi:glycosyltransferase involved in cell wall biosynthesis
MISVILPYRDAAGTLVRAVSSLLDGTRADVEVLAVNDNSRDTGPELLHALAMRDGRIRPLMAVGRGLVAALTQGLEAARGTYIARMDADDVSMPGRLDAQAAWLDARPETGVVGGRVDFGGDAATAAGYALHVDWCNALRTHDDIALARFVESPLVHPSVMFRRALVAAHGGYRDGPFPEDYELWLRWLDAGVRMEKIPRTVLRWSDPPDRLSRRDPRYDPTAFYGTKAHWLARWLSRHNPHHPDVIVWGAGRITRRRAGLLTDHGITIRAYVDIDPRKIGGTADGLPVLAPAALPPPEDCFVLSYVGSRDARVRILHDLAGRGFREGVHCLSAA